MKCSICNKTIEGYGNNPSPLNRGKCCDECNSNVIIPLRMFFAGQVKDRVLVIKASGELKTEKLDKENVSLEQLQELVGGYIEVYPYRSDKFDILVDEEGLLKEKEFNELAYEILNIEAVGDVAVCPKGYLK